MIPKTPFCVALLALATMTAFAADGAPAMALTSPAFEQGKPIPVRFSCEGADVSPALAWTGVPEGTRSLALICDDPDAPGGAWCHWVVYNLPPSVQGLPEHVSPDDAPADGQASQGGNSWGRLKYAGPCPPPGKAHRYVFTLYALDTTLVMKPGATKDALLNAMARHVMAQAELTGTFGR
jgi:hypothetical protein